MRALPLLLLAPLVAGCFPTLPACDDACDPPATETDGTGPTTDGTGTSGSPTTSGSVGDDTATSDTDDGDSSGGSDTGDTGSPLGDCEPKVSALEWDVGQLTISNDLFSLHFDDSSSYTPNSLTIEEGDDQNVIYAGPSQDERHMGVLKFPNNDASWQVDGGFEVFEDGPVVTRLSTGWTTPDIMGETRYTFIADGRIVRHESVYNMQGGGTHLTAYVALDPARFDTVQWYGDQEGAMSLPDRGPAVPDSFLQSGPGDSVVSCAHGRTGNVVGYAAHGFPAVGPLPGRPGPGARASVSQVEGPDSFQFALQQDWVRDGTVTDDTSYDAWVLTIVDGSTSEPCSCVAAHAFPFMDPPALVGRSGGSATAYAPGDVDGDTFNEETGAYEISTMDNAPPYEFSVMGRTLPTLLLRMQYVVGIDGISVGGTPLVADVDYMTQVAGDGWTETMWVLVRGPIPADTVVSIDYVAP